MCDYLREEEIEMDITLLSSNDYEQEEELRHGGPQADDDEEQRKMDERERKKAEVRARLAEQSAKKSKKGFLTPERKKKLRKLLMLKAAEDLKQQQLLKEEERKRVLEERCPSMPDIDSIDDIDQLMRIADDLHKKFCEVMETKYDHEIQVHSKDHEINELTIEVNNLRGKLFAQMADDAATKKKVDLRQGLKQVEKKEFTLEDLDKDKEDKPQWADKPLADADERELDSPPPEEAGEEEEEEEEEEE